ncbi:MAG TPA: acetyl-CoA C-acyltransferase, partial [Oligoflexia bacterium]|nr:acetyl-CoA C-acyltransferase [Oligoflexia bacterium]
MSTQNLVFLGAKRTPFGAFGGSLRDASPADMATAASKAALVQSGVAPSEIQHVIVGNVVQATADAILVPRHTGLKSGVPLEIPALGVNRLCGSGFQVVVDAYAQMCAGDTEVALVGGTESMSLVPYVVRGARWGSKMGHTQFEDYLTAALTDTYCGCSGPPC